MYSSAVLLAAVLATVAVNLSSCGGGASQGSGPGPPPTTFPLTVSAGSGGIITSSPSGINCGSACSASFSSGTKVTLSATPSSGDSFASWSGACSGSSLTCTLTMNGATSVSATFSRTQVQLSVSETGAGTITSNPAGINCGGICTADFNSGSTVTLTATPAAGNSFNGWSGACSGSSATCAVVLNAASSVAASFNATRAELSVSEIGSGTGTITSSPAGINCQSWSASFPRGAAVTLMANPDSSYQFTGWSGACSGTGPCTVTLEGATSVIAQFSATLQSINHIIFMAQENHSFDEYFGKLNDYRQANGLPTDVDGLPPDASNPSANGSGTVPVFHMLSMCMENPSPYWPGAHTDFNRSDPTSTDFKMDGFVTASSIFAISRGLYDRQGIRAMGYYTAQDLPYYYFMASNFATSDRWFSPVLAETPPNRLYLMSATSLGHVYPLPPGSPLLTNKNIFQLLEENGISWKVYVTDPSPSAVAASAMSMFAFSFKHAGNFVPISQYLSDVANGTLPAVAMIEPGYLSARDEHPVGSDGGEPGGSVQVGSAYVASLMNALIAGPSWKDSVFILTYDEYGGFYDHVPPQPTVSPDGILPSDLQPGDPCNDGSGKSIGGGTCDFLYAGYRVPLIVVSPFVKKNYVSHTLADHTAILKFIETRFNLPNLTMRDAAQMDMTEFFDFVNMPWKIPPRPPTQPTGGPCYVNHLP
jgi:phospholipase C